jgi:hypothetical protein
MQMNATDAKNNVAKLTETMTRHALNLVEVNSIYGREKCLFIIDNYMYSHKNVMQVASRLRSRGFKVRTINSCEYGIEISWE